MVRSMFTERGYSMKNIGSEQRRLLTLALYLHMHVCVHIQPNTYRPTHVQTCTHITDTCKNKNTLKKPKKSKVTNESLDDVFMQIFINTEEGLN